MKELQIYNTAQKTKCTFIPLKPEEISIYVCGLTVYDLPHIGHARTFVVFDVIKRFLSTLGYRVTLVRNHTDIDDKIIRRAREENISPEELANQMIDGLVSDMGALGVMRADVEPRVTQHIPQILEFIQKLLDKNLAYETNGDVYFRVANFPEYGALSHRNLDDLLQGVRKELSDNKEAPADFALWKASKSENEPAWDSPWGKGRPGWHIECSVMSTHYLGNSFDIHGGGRDLIFPHHENEIAQAKGAQEGDFARYWMHVGMVEINNEKMSHSLKNFSTIRELIEKVHPDAVRYFFLTTHYRHNINYSQKTITEATLRITSLYRTLKTTQAAIDKYLAKNPDLPTITPDHCLDEFNDAMCDDFNTPKALAIMATCAKQANELVEAKGKLKEDRVIKIAQLRQALLAMGTSVGLFEISPDNALESLKAYAIKRLGIDVNKVEEGIAQRTKARAEKNWALADAIRVDLEQSGVTILDTPEGTIWQVD